MRTYESRHVRVLAGQGVQQIYSLAADGARLLAAGHVHEGTRRRARRGIAGLKRP